MSDETASNRQQNRQQKAARVPERHVIARVKRGTTAEIFVQLVRTRRWWYVEVGTLHLLDGGVWSPPRGVSSLPAELVPELVAALQEADSKAQALGNLRTVGQQVAREVRIAGALKCRRGPRSQSIQPNSEQPARPRLSREQRYNRLREASPVHRGWNHA